MMNAFQVGLVFEKVSCEKFNMYCRAIRHRRHAMFSDIPDTFAGPRVIIRQIGRAVEEFPSTANDGSGFRGFRMIVQSGTLIMQRRCTFRCHCASIQNTAVGKRVEGGEI